MANLNTTQLAHTLLGPSMRLYHQDLTFHANQPRLKIDKLGAGDFGSVESPVVANSHPTYTYEQNGLLLTIERPLNVNGNMGIFAATKLQNLVIPVPTQFVLTATFREPKQVSLNAQPAQGTYAAAILLNVAGTTMGATSQFRTTGQRLNLPGTGVMPNRPDISSDLSDKVSSAQNPSPFSLVLHVNRAIGSSTGKAYLIVGDETADTIDFTFANGLTSATVIDDFYVGLGTANGAQYRVSLRVLEFEVWAPTPNQ